MLKAIGTFHENDGRTFGNNGQYQKKIAHNRSFIRRCTINTFHLIMVITIVFRKQKAGTQRS
jgi:hypothetical protein